jgi:hypothetical protein
MDNSLPGAKSAHSPDERENLKRVVGSRNLCGLANDTKWNEFITAMRSRQGWRPRYRFKCIDGPPSSWDREWFYHLPFPMISVEWLDLEYFQETTIHRLPPRVEVTDHSEWLVELLKRIGLDFQKGREVIRIFGYSPKNLDLFEA